MARKLGRKKSNREHLIRNLATSLVLYEVIDTTEAKGKEVKNFTEKLLARCKENTLSDKRNLNSVLFDKNAAKKIVNELLPRYEKRKSGFVRSFHLKNRLGDNAAMIRLELVDKKVFTEQAETKKTEDVVTEVKTKRTSKKEAK